MLAQVYTGSLKANPTHLRESRFALSFLLAGLKLAVLLTETRVLKHGPLGLLGKKANNSSIPRCQTRSKLVRRLRRKAAESFAALVGFATPAGGLA